jgi:hypothetical protein
MAISNDLFRAILALDSYNRGYKAGVTLGSNTQIGTATLRNDISLPTDYQSASFFAQAHTWNGTTVISFRGTDKAFPSWQNGTLGDFENCWFTGAGLR